MQKRSAETTVTVPVPDHHPEIAIEHQGELVFVNEDGTWLRPGPFHELLWAAQRRAGLRRIPWHQLARV